MLVPLFSQLRLDGDQIRLKDEALLLGRQIRDDYLLVELRFDLDPLEDAGPPLAIPKALPKPKGLARIDCKRFHRSCATMRRHCGFQEVVHFSTSSSVLAGAPA